MKTLTENTALVIQMMNTKINIANMTFNKTDDSNEGAQLAIYLSSH